MDPARFRKISFEVFGSKLTIEQAIGEVEKRQKKLASEIRTLQVIIKGIITDFEYEKLKGLAADGLFSVHFRWDMFNELLRLRAIAHVEPLPGFGISSIKAHDGSDKEFDLKTYVRITKEGLEYLKLREELFTS